jgi:hypothetical protein
MTMAAGDWRSEGVSSPYRIAANTTPVMDNQSGRLRMMIDTAFFDLPMVLDAGPVAALTYLAAYFYVTRHATNGKISKGAVGALLDWSQLGVSADQAAERCIAAGLMERTGNGFRLGDYHGQPNGGNP